MKKRVSIFLLTALIMIGVVCVNFVITSPVNVYATGVEDFLDENTGNDSNSSSSDSSALGDWIKNQQGMSNEQFETATKVVSPVTNFFGYIVGGIVALIFGAIFVITALDLLYLAIPPVRGFLYQPGTDGTGAMTNGAMMGGMYGGGMQQQQSPVTKKKQWISDEAVMCAAMLGGSAQAQGGSMGAMPMGGGYGYGARGGMYGGMGAMMGAQGATAEPMSMKMVLGVYFKKRMFFMILLVVCVIVLTSSVLLGTGVNLAQWVIKLTEAINGYLS